MFIILLRFSDNKAQAGEFMEGHNQWLERGFEDGVFLVAGSIQPGAGGAVLAHDTSEEALEERVKEDPFVAEDVVAAEVIAISPSRCTNRMRFLIEQDQQFSQATG